MASLSQPPFIPLACSRRSNRFFRYNNSKIVSSNESSSSKLQNDSPNSTSKQVDQTKISFARALAYKKSVNLNNPAPDDEANMENKKTTAIAGNGREVSKISTNSSAQTIPMDEANEERKSGGEKNKVPLSVKRAVEKAKEYKKNRGLVSDNDGVVEGEELASDMGLQGRLDKIRGDERSNKNASKEGLSISSIDFLGLSFSDKKTGRGLPAGLVPVSEPYSEGELPEVEIIVGDISRFSDASTAPKQIPVEENDSELYRPKVSTWGLFPRPSNISETYGGGKNISPGVALETEEERAAKDARTKQLLAAYNRKTGLNIDIKLKSESEKALRDGDSLMDLGKLKESVPFYEEVMEKMPYQSELHGLAALQLSICLDSLGRSNEARIMYEKLQSHPIPKVRKKAKQFFFGFQAMTMMKVRSSSSSSPPEFGYQNYFDAFLQEKKSYTSGEVEEDESGLKQAVPYMIFLVAPIFLLLLIAASRFQ